MTACTQEVVVLLFLSPSSFSSSCEKEDKLKGVKLLLAGKLAGERFCAGCIRRLTSPVDI